ncbi:MAG: hypothetical protein Q8S08_07045, partial [Halomonas sp.]
MNPRHRAYQLLYQATHALRQHSKQAVLTPKTPSCACCDRPWAEVEAPFQAAEYYYGKSGEAEYLCLTCYTPRISSEVMLGIERMNITGNTRTEIYGKLGMLVGSGGIITPQAELYLTLPPKLHEKYQSGEWGQQGRLSTEKPLVRLLQLLVQGALAPIEEGFVYIENWGRKADGLMRQLTPTTSLHEVWCNSENGVSVLDLHAMLRTANVMSEQGIEAQAGRLAFWAPIIDAAKGRRDEHAFAKWLTKVPDPAALLQALPADPYSRLKLPAVLGIL